MTARLEVCGLSRMFGGLRALSDVSFATRQGEVFGIIGPNGAGKTTLFNVIAGIYRPSSGDVLLDGVSIRGRAPDAVARQGIARTFQSTTSFGTETVRGNLERSQLLRDMSSPAVWLRQCLRRPDRPKMAEETNRILEFVGLTDYADQGATELPYGLQKILGLGMALVQRPSLLLMDEPAAGLNPTEKLGMARLIRRIRDELSIDVIVVEHDMKLIMSSCDRILVLNYGRQIVTGTPAEVQSDTAVIDAYLGADYEFA